jgi:exonuclease III
MALLNIVSLPSHVDELRISKLFLHFDLLALNETRLDPSIPDGLVKIHGYDIVRNDRSRRGGGVCIYLRSTINYKIRSDLVPDGIEAICLEISKPNSRNFIVASVYRPPNSTPEFFLTFEKMIKMIDDENKELHILGDLNCDMLTNIPNHPTKTLKGILETYQLSQLITEATRITTSSCTLIDHYNNIYA